MALTFKLFTGHWCPACTHRSQFISDLCIKHDLNFEAVPIEDKASRTEAEKYHIKRIPVVVVLDEQGEVLVQFSPSATKTQITRWLEERMSFDARSNGKSTKEAG